LVNFYFGGLICLGYEFFSFDPLGYFQASKFYFTLIYQSLKIKFQIYNISEFIFRIFSNYATILHSKPYMKPINSPLPITTTYIIVFTPFSPQIHIIFLFLQNFLDPDPCFYLKSMASSSKFQIHGFSLTHT
jgi:hypothetical protein